jgi:hypothetical protein
LYYTLNDAAFADFETSKAIAGAQALKASECISLNWRRDNAANFFFSQQRCTFDRWYCDSHCTCVYTMFLGLGLGPVLGTLCLERVSFLENNTFEKVTNNSPGVL